MSTDGFTVVRTYFPRIETGNALNAAADSECTRETMVSFYADCIRAGTECDWPAINAAILNRWPRGLQWIKQQAWKGLASVPAPETRK